ncbi:glycosyltransferase family 4 protein [Parvularcula marina]|uniref:Glycosyltransferase n=1 Tax=Parvularcula marina TaxID=2292771 RepID=A0A371RFG8_9PROT|nr:glycosyltransferase family 4 protein [Parvularcula marina]RFB04187.1 glycosyltransferase [Parvularcula marina]
MTLHYITGASAEADDWPLSRKLDSEIPDYRIFCGDASPRYRTKAALLFREYPKMIWFALKKSWQSIFARPKPDVVLAHTDIILFCYGLLKLLSFSSKPRLVWLGYIYSEKGTGLVGRLNRLFHRIVIGFCARVITYAGSDEEACRRVFPSQAEKFSTTLYGVGLGFTPKPYSEQARAGTILSAGRSQRDYACLAEAISDTDYAVDIVCDNLDACPDRLASEKVRIHRKVHGRDFIDMLQSAELVVVPLSDTSASAGHMVMQQAMAYRKPVIVTDIPSIRDYIFSDDSLVLVPPNDPAALAAAIDRLMKDDAARDALAGRAGEIFDAHLSMDRMAERVTELMKAELAAADSQPI